ncbi:MAG: TIGR03905 family TSCPD domain-containing protein [Muribaculaceae bacterium]|nr:TIGR03905 family TSCPD domain-containing protein [Muribaculaceae bacterium]
MKQISFTTSGTCSKAINLEIDEEGRIHNVQFVGGCPGNTFGVARLVEGRKANEVIATLKGITCGAKPTSCPDQLAHALEQALIQ